MFRTKKSRLVALLALLVVTLTAGLALALITPGNLSLELREVEKTRSYFGIPTATEVTAGSNNVVIAVSSLGADGGAAVDGGDAGALNIDAGPKTVTNSTANPDMPSQLAVVLVDVSANSTLTCASVKITGEDAYGRVAVETVSNVTETVQYTNTAFSKVTSAVLTGCGGGTSSTDDYLRISGSAKIALPIRARQVGDIINVCVVDRLATDAGTPVKKCWSGARLSALGAVSLTYQVVDLLDTDITNELVGVGASPDGGSYGIQTGDGITISVRPNPAFPN